MDGGLAELRLVIAPGTGFAAISGTMLASGLRPVPAEAVTPPLIPGEPEFASWISDEDGSRVDYSFNPPVLLRVLSVSGASSPRWHSLLSGALEVFDTNHLAALLQSASRRELLLGLYAAAELRAIELIAAVEALRIHTDRRVSQAAARTAEILAREILSLGAERLAAKQRRHPQRSAVFAHLGNAEIRRQTLVWLMRDGHGGSPETLKALRSGLADSDWRVRVTAMFVTARLKLPVLWQEVRQAELPVTSRSGIDGRERSLLRAARKAMLSELAGEPLPQDESAEARLTRELRDAIAGRGAADHEIGEWVNGWFAPE